MNRIVIASVVGSLLGLGSGVAFGHGGQYRGPGDTVPPAEGPGPGTGGPSTGGPTTPGPGGPTTPGGGRGPTTPGDGPGGPGGPGGGRGPVTGGGLGGKKNRPGEGFEQWQFWWEANKDPYLDLKSRLGGSPSVSGSAGFLAGLGRKVEADRTNRPTAAEINDQIVPTLKSVLGEDDADILDSAVLALGRVVRPDSAALVLEDIKGALANENSTVQQAAILALGVLGSSEAIPLLKEIMSDSPQGRTLLKERNKIQDLQRSFAALSLGFIGAEESISLLEEVVNKTPDSDKDLKSSAIVALGLFSTGKERIVPFLNQLLGDEKLDDTIRAQVPISLGRLGEAAAPVQQDLLRLVKSRKTNIRLEESCVIALGLISKPEDAAVVSTLLDVIKEGQNDQSRHFAFISLAQIGARAAKNPEVEANRKVLDELQKFLLKELTKPDQKAHIPWAAIALAIIGREFTDSSQDYLTIVTKIQEALEENNDPSHQSAFAVALGLLNARNAGKMLYEEMLDTNEDNFKGYLAVSLGMMRYNEALDTLRNMVKDNRDAKLRLQAATALGLMGDTEAVPVLVEELRKAETLNVISSLAKALGLIGDRSAIQPLQELVADDKAPGLARAFGCVALGLIGEKFQYYWNTPVSTNANYRIVLPSQYEVTDIL
jgi:HEAT repeat protein